MDDPFGLLEIAAGPKEDNKKNLPKRTYLTVISVLVVFVLIFTAIFLFQNTGEISADTVSPAASIKITNLPGSVKVGQDISFNLVFTNKGDAIKGGYALVQGEGMNVAKTIEKEKNTKIGEPGYTRKMTEQEFLRFDQRADSGLRNDIGAIGANESKSIHLSATITSGASVPSFLEAKLYMPRTITRKCGFLKIKKCTSSAEDTQIAYGSFQIDPSEIGKIKLREGFNFVSLPYVFTTGLLTDFFSSLKTKWAYVYDPTTAAYIDLTKGDNSSRVKPGAAFWLYDKKGAEYELPEERVETNPNETYSISLSIGWNQIGNPYSKRMVLSGTKISVRELADDGSESGSSYDLKTAISNGVLGDPYFIVYPSSTATAVSTARALLDSTMEPYSGFLINATKKVNLVIPGKDVITAGDNLSAQERSKIENWISQNGLNQFGDSAGTVYAGGTPLFDEATGQTIDRFDYILKRYPDRPWNR